MLNDDEEKYGDVHKVFEDSVRDSMRQVLADYEKKIFQEILNPSDSTAQEIDDNTVYTMGSPDPRSFTRGKRGLAGNAINFNDLIIKPWHNVVEKPCLEVVSYPRISCKPLGDVVPGTLKVYAGKTRLSMGSEYTFDPETQEVVIRSHFVKELPDFIDQKYPHIKVVADAVDRSPFQELLLLPRQMDGGYTFSDDHLQSLVKDMVPYQTSFHAQSLLRYRDNRIRLQSLENNYLVFGEFALTPEGIVGRQMGVYS